MEQNRKPRNKPMLIWSINLQQRRQEYTTEKTDSLINGVGKLDSYKKNETRPFSHTIYKK